MTNPSWVAERWLYEVLANDAQLAALGVAGVYVDVVPSGTTGLYVYITGQSFDDIAYIGERIVYTRTEYAVRVMGEVGGYGDLEPAAARMHALLHRARGSTDAGAVMSCFRDRPLRLVERQTDRTVYQLGGLYRIYV